jgi:hypothetical protein
MEKKGKTILDYNPEDIFKLDPTKLANLMQEGFSFTIPFNEEDISIHDLSYMQALIVKAGNAFPYLAYLNSLAKIQVRKAKREKLSKEEIEDAIDRKEVISNITESVNMQYNAISRLITVKQQINEELKMTNGR